MKRKRNKSREIIRCCADCEHCIPIGGGDHICDEAEPDEALVIEEYIPGDCYMWCNGKKWEARGE